MARTMTHATSQGLVGSKVGVDDVLTDKFPSPNTCPMREHVLEKSSWRGEAHYRPFVC